MRYTEIGGYLNNFGTGGAYSATYADDSDVGFVVGAAYEIPDIKLRVALTYSSETEHTLDVNAPGFGTGTTDVTMPASINLDFQSGVAADTLVFGSIRWAEWKETSLFDPVLNGVLTGAGNLVGHDSNTFTYTLGVGRRLTDNLSAFARIGFEKSQGGLAPNLSPTDGNRSIGLGGTYTIDNIEITGGVTYIKIGDANTEAPVNADFSDNSATAIGLKVAYKF